MIAIAMVVFVSSGAFSGQSAGGLDEAVRAPNHWAGFVVGNGHSDEGRRYLRAQHRLG